MDCGGRIAGFSPRQKKGLFIDSKISQKEKILKDTQQSRTDKPKPHIGHRHICPHEVRSYLVRTRAHITTLPAINLRQYSIEKNQGVYELIQFVTRFSFSIPISYSSVLHRKKKELQSQSVCSF